MSAPPKSAPGVNKNPTYDNVEFSPDGTRVAYIDEQAVLRVLRVSDRRLIRSLKFDENVLPDEIMFAPDNETIAVGQRDKTGKTGQYTEVVRTGVWNLRTGQRMGTLQATSSKGYTAVKILDGGQLLVRKTSKENYSEKNLLLWNPKTGKTTKTPIPISAADQLRCSVISPDAKELVTGDALGNVRWFSIKTGKQLHQQNNHLTQKDYEDRFGDGFISNSEQPLAVNGIDYSLGGAYLASRNNAQIDVFDSKANKIRSLAISDYFGMGFAISPDGKWVAARSGLNGPTLGSLLWNVKTGQRIRLNSPVTNLRGFGFSPDSKQLYGICAAGDRFQIVTWNVNDKPIQKEKFAISSETSFPSPNTSGLAVLSLPTSQAGELVATATERGVEIRTIKGSLNTTLKVGTSDVNELKFSPDGTRLGIRDGDGALQLWNVNTKEAILRLPTDESAGKRQSNSPDASGEVLRDIAFSPDNNYFAGARVKSDGQVIELWSLKNTPRLLATFAQKEPVSALLFSPDNKGLVCGNRKGLLQWYDVATRRTQTQLKTGDPIFDLAFAARNLVVMGANATSSYELPAKSEDPLEWASRTKFSAQFNLSRDFYTESAISPNGKLLAASQGSKIILICHLPSGAILQDFLINRDHKSSVTYSLAFSDDGAELISVGQQVGSSQLTVTTYSRDKTK